MSACRRSTRADARIGAGGAGGASKARKSVIAPWWKVFGSYRTYLPYQPYCPPLRVHRPVLTKRQPPAHDPVDEPDAHRDERHPRDDDADAECEDDEEHAKRDPQQAVPERANLPAEMRFEPRAANVAALH